VPAVRPVLSAGASGADTLLSWTADEAATGYDIVRGDLAVLSGTAGDFTQAIDLCVANDRAETSVLVSQAPEAGGGQFFLVRPVNCGGAGTFDSGEPSQVGSRDLEIGAALATCP